MKILLFISLFVVFASASQELEVPTENNVAKKEDNSTNLLLIPPVDDVSKPLNVSSIEPTTTTPATSASPDSTNTKAKGKRIRHRKPLYERPRYLYRHTGSIDHMTPRPRLPTGPVDWTYRRPIHHHDTWSHRQPVYRVPNRIKTYNRYNRINRRRGNHYYY
uniref:SFRICE_039896 n=1 Tax=Spodoptera frugiperda TaxID=7108 RepID=A0A2H1W181_SPOFR